MESTIDGESRQTKSLVVEDLREADRQIDTRGERFGTFFDESLGYLLLSVEEDSLRDLLTKNKAEHKSGVPCSSAHDSIKDAMRSTWLDTESIVTRSMVHSRGRYLKRVKRTV